MFYRPVTSSVAKNSHQATEHTRAQRAREYLNTRRRGLSMTLDTNRVRELLVKMAHHQQRCVSLVHASSHRMLARSAHRFVKIEKVMIKKMAMVFLDQDGEPLIKEAACKQRLASFADYTEMHAMNKRLLDEVKSLLKTIDDTHLTALVSYWLAALQVENDELQKHLPQGE